MTLAYSLCFVLSWAPTILAIPAAIGLFVWFVVVVQPHHEQDHSLTIVLLAVACMVLVFYTIASRNHRFRVLIRNGAFPCASWGDAYPTTVEELRHAAADVLMRNGRVPVVVGGGWGAYLRREGPKPPRIWTHRFKGRVEGAPNTWKGGTTIAAVNKALLARGQTLAVHPTMDYISIGAWVATASHGNGGDASEGDAGVFDGIELLDMRKDSIDIVSYQVARKRFNSARQRDFCVLSITFVPVPNIDVQKRGIVVDSPEAASEWLKPGAINRLLFLGAARTYAIGLRWERPYNDTKHRDPHFCSRFCLFFQIDVCSAVCGYHESMEKFNGKTTLHEANKWIPHIFPIMSVAVVCAGVKNFEIFFRLDEALNGNILHSFLKAAIAMHRRIGGRSEIRYGRPAASTMIFWDISLSKHFKEPFKLLADVLNVEACALHPGKYTDLLTTPLVRYSSVELEYGRFPLSVLKYP